MSEPKTIICLASFFKGEAFMRLCKEEGARVILITKENLKDEAWPWDAIDEAFFMPNLSRQPDITYAVSYLARHRIVDQVMPLDDYDVPTAADLREHLRLPGMGATVTRYFRDKLAMRMGAQAGGLLVPPFSGVFNHGQLQQYMDHVPGPWVLKPRTEAGAMGIKKINAQAELWPLLEKLGDEQSFFLLEQFIPGDVYHVDSLIRDGEVIFAVAHKYGRPPMQVAHQGGVFITRTLPREGEEATTLRALNAQLMRALGMRNGVSHTEFIRAHADGRFYFLETAARVGGANIAETVEYATGLNLWREWARMTMCQLRGQRYELPPVRADYAGILICLARQEHPDLSAYQDAEIVYRLHKKQHAGLIVASHDAGRIEYLLQEYGDRFARDFLAVAPPLDKAPQ
ncbi:MAG: ATP-grasp domain-containing protein [Anaerolineales bacterium]|nr:ATP-grasp domain-containing protein [Anaerolineales bacterium]MCB8951025.1 ATP-grasp domain-containing protein [Ardenticatenales bacterium]